MLSLFLMQSMIFYDVSGSFVTLSHSTNDVDSNYSATEHLQSPWLHHHTEDQLYRILGKGEGAILCFTHAGGCDRGKASDALGWHCEHPNYNCWQPRCEYLSPLSLLLRLKLSTSHQLNSRSVWTSDQVYKLVSTTGK